MTMYIDIYNTIGELEENVEKAREWMNRKRNELERKFDSLHIPESEISIWCADEERKANAAEEKYEQAKMIYEDACAAQKRGETICPKWVDAYWAQKQREYLKNK